MNRHSKGRPLGRRQVLKFATAGTAGVGAAYLLERVATVSASGISGPGAVPAAKGPLTGLPVLPARANIASSDGAQSFRSRPDLRPPVVTISTPAAPSAAPGLVITETHGQGAQQGPMIVDEHGQLVWFQPLSAGGETSLRAFNVKVQSYQGKPVLAYFQGAVVEGHGRGQYLLLGPDYRPIKTLKAANGYMGDLHDLELTPQGTALFTCYGQATADLTKYGGSKSGIYFYGVMQEVDLATGKLLFQWRSDQHVPLSESYAPAPNSTIVPWDYFHINSVAVDPSDGNFIISGRNTWAFYKVDRSTGKILWQAGGKGDQFQRGPGVHWAFQHDVRLYEGGVLTVFDNEGGPPNEASQSRGLILALDEKARRISLVKQLLHQPPVLTGALGDVQILPNGHHFVGWGESPYFTEYDASGRVVFDGRLSTGCESYRAFKQAWTGTPANKPAVALARSGAALDLFASWNGATRVAWWVVLGGDKPSSLAPLGRAKRAGFETQLTLAHPPAYVAVEAASASGAVLARSGTAKTPG